MVNDPAPIKDLADRLGDLVDAVAKAPTFDAVPESFRSQWKLTPALFDDIREASDTPERSEDLRRRITRAFEPLIHDGVLGPDVLPRHEEGSRELSVHLLGEPREKAHQVPRDRVMRERLDKSENPVGKEFIAAFNPPTLGLGLFTLIADRLAGKADPRLRGVAHQQAPRGGPQGRRRGLRAPHARRNCWSSKARRLARSNCCCSARSTTSPTRP